MHGTIEVTDRGIVVSTQDGHASTTVIYGTTFVEDLEQLAADFGVPVKKMQAVIQRAIA